LRGGLAVITETLPRDVCCVCGVSVSVACALVSFVKEV